MMYYKSTILFLLLCPIVLMAAGPKDEHRVRLTKEFNLQNGGRLEVNNKYGKVVVNVWDKQECKADIEIVGAGRTQDQAKKMAESVEIAQSGGSSSTQLETKYSVSPGKWFGGSGKRDSRDGVTVNYVIHVPRKLGAMVIKNQFGDVIAYELPFKTSDISVNYGFLDIGNASGTLRLTINYTDKARIGNAERMQVNANYSNLRCEKVEDLTINSNNGNYVIGNAENMKMNCNYDDYKVSKATTIRLSANYTNLKTELLREQGVFSTNYTDVTINKLNYDFKELVINGRYCTYKVGLEKNAQFRINASLHYGDLNTKAFSWKDVSTTKKNSNLSFSAITTNATSSAGSIRIDGSYTDVKLGGE